MGECSLPAPDLDLSGKGGNNKNASFNCVRLPGCVGVMTGAGVDALTPVALKKLTTARDRLLLPSKQGPGLFVIAPHNGERGCRGFYSSHSGDSYR